MRMHIRLLAPLSHGAFDAAGDGNTMPLRRFPVLAAGGVPVGVPAVSGNALRGCVRRHLMRDMFGVLGLKHTTPGFDHAYATAANGGSLEGFDKDADPARARAVREACPPLSLLGAGMKTWFLPGRISVGISWPVCDVTVEAGLCVVPEGANDTPALADIETEVYHARLPDREHHDTDRSGVKPMPHGFEALVPGVECQADIRFHPSATAAERAAWWHGISLVDALGGKSGSGMGHVSIHVPGLPDTARAPYLDWLLSPEAAEGVEAALFPR